MKKLIFSGLLTTLCLLALAQPSGTEASAEVAASPGVPVGTSLQDFLDAERKRIASERARLESDAAVRQAACYKKFWVNDCLDEIKAQRRIWVADLRRQEISLDEQDRKAKAAQQIQKTEDKASPEKQQEAADRRAQALKDTESRLERDQQKNADRAAMKAGEKSNLDAAASRLKGSQDKALGRSSQQTKSAEEVKKFNDRQEKAKERQARHERDQLNQSKPPAKSLPTPD